MSCAERCSECLGLVPWASLIALLVCWAGTALFCGTGHEALTLSLQLMNGASIPGFDLTVSRIDEVFQSFKYAIYAIASYMFVLSVLLFSDGVLSTRAVKKEIDFSCKETKCGTCSNVMYTCISYVTSIGWLLMSAFAALPLYFFQVSNSQCDIVKSAAANATDDVCVDFVQAGLMPYQQTSIDGYGRLCGGDLKSTCEEDEYTLTYQMYLIAFAGSCIAVIGMKHFLMTLSANFAYVRMARKLADYQDTKFREEMELNDIINTARSNERLTYKY